MIILKAHNLYQHAVRWIILKLRCVGTTVNNVIKNRSQIKNDDFKYFMIFFKNKILALCFDKIKKKAHGQLRRRITCTLRHHHGLLRRPPLHLPLRQPRRRQTRLFRSLHPRCHRRRERNLPHLEQSSKHQKKPKRTNVHFFILTKKHKKKQKYYYLKNIFFSFLIERRRNKKKWKI